VQQNTSSPGTIALEMRVRLGVDTGGTFTDFVLVDTDDRVIGVDKRLTTAEEPARGVFEGAETLLQSHAMSLGDVQDFVLGTTLASNLVLERKGPATAVLTTRGFRDVLLIGRQKRYDQYNLEIEKPRPLVQRRRIYEIDERTHADGSIVTLVTEQSVSSVVKELRRRGIQSIAICFINSYVNPANERSAAALLARALPEVAISLSSDVAPQWREYERTSTTVVNAYTKPALNEYLDVLDRELGARGLQNQVLVMQSNGGIAASRTVRERSVSLVESGPAAGVILATRIGALLGAPNVISLDIGGTTAKFCLISDGAPAIADTFEIDKVGLARQSGLPISVPAADLIEIGAGGGSIARVSALGLLTVGPDSAGASPGPICYGRGGREPTVTDADLVLGYLNPGFFAGGRMQLDLDAARDGIETHIGRTLNMTVERAAWAIHEVVNTSMIAAARAASLERGADPRNYTLVAFGGAGPVHAARLARGLGVKRIVIPFAAGVGSAAGLLTSEVKFDLVRTLRWPLASDDHAPVNAIYSDLEQRAMSMGAEAVGPDRVQSLRFARSADLRYVGQGFELRVPFPGGTFDLSTARQLTERFNELYRRTYGRNDEGEPVEVVNWRVEARLPGETEHLDFSSLRRRAKLRPRSSRYAYFPETGAVECIVLDRYSLEEGDLIKGPAIIEENESTTVVLPSDSVRLDASGNLVVTIGEH
jgi:N-methylhydantoinase A